MQASEDCTHAETSIVRVRYQSGLEQARELCDRCGRNVRGPIKRAQLANIYEELPIVEQSEVEQLRNQYFDALFAERAIEREERYQADREEWLERYNEYLQSPAWKELRAKVIARDGGVCRGCLSARAEVVHHLTYANVFNELAYELVTLCHACHVRAHEAPRLAGLLP